MSHILRFSLPGPEAISLPDTLDCGQSFRFSQNPDGSFSGVAGGRFATVSLSDSTLSVECFCRTGESTPADCESFWRDYFDLNRDYDVLKLLFSSDETMKKAVAYCPGVRLLRQEPFEALCSFIISQNNNIPRIKGIISRLCECFGEPLPGGQFAFPIPAAIAGKTVEDLAPLRSGFRAKYLLDAAERVHNGSISLCGLSRLSYDDARVKLMEIKGVGPKVADCVLLYGMARVESLPRDVWIKRALEQLYPEGFPEEFAPVAGIAQQYLFHYCRTCPEAGLVVKSEK